MDRNKAKRQHQCLQKYFEEKESTDNKDSKKLVIDDSPKEDQTQESSKEDQTQESPREDQTQKSKEPHTPPGSPSHPTHADSQPFSAHSESVRGRICNSSSSVNGSSRGRSCSESASSSSSGRSCPGSDSSSSSGRSCSGSDSGSSSKSDGSRRDSSSSSGSDGSESDDEVKTDEVKTDLILNWNAMQPKVDHAAYTWYFKEQPEKRKQEAESKENIVQEKDQTQKSKEPHTPPASPPHPT